MIGKVDRWNGKNYTGLVIKNNEEEFWLNCKPELLQSIISRGLKIGDEVYYETSDRYKKQVVRLMFKNDYEDYIKKINADQLPKEEETKRIEWRQEYPLLSEREIRILERIAVALEVISKKQSGV